MKIDYWLAASVVLLWVVFGFVIPFYFGGVQTSGAWGDTFGAFSALINGIGFIALYSTIKLQRETMDLQRESMTAQLIFNQEQRAESQFKFLYEHLSNLDHDLEKFTFATNHPGIASIDALQSFVKENRHNDSYEHQLKYLGEIFNQVISYHHLLANGKRTISLDEFKTLKARLLSLRARYIEKLALTTLNSQQSGFAVTVHKMANDIMSLELIVLI